MTSSTATRQLGFESFAQASLVELRANWINSGEYQDNFGESIVPSYRGFLTQREQKTVGFNCIQM